MGRTPAGDRRPSKMRKSEGAGTTTTIQSLDQDILCMIFAFLDFFDLVRCSAVCKFWNTIVSKSKLLQVFYSKQQRDSIDFSNKSTCSERSLKRYLEEQAMEHNRLCLQEGRIDINQWQGHSVGAE